MNILLITVRSDFGGGPRHVDQLVRNLPDECKIYMAYPEGGVPYGQMWRQNERIAGTIYIPYRKFSFSALLKLRHFIKVNDIDIVHSHGNGAGIYSRILKFIGTKVKVVHTFHGISLVYSSKIKYALSFLAGRFLAPYADRYVTVSFGEKQIGIKRGFCKDSNCDVVYNGIEDCGYRVDPLAGSTIMSITRYNYQKNMNFSVEIARRMKDDGVRFVWVGDGDGFAQIKQLVDDNHLPVDLVGHQDNPMKYMSKAKVYLTTSRFEGLPYALIEAASIGMPIVATDVIGNNEVAIHNQNGFTFHTVEEGVTALRRLLNDSELYDRMSKGSRKLYEDQFTEAVMIDRLMMIYHALI